VNNIDAIEQIINRGGAVDNFSTTRTYDNKSKLSLDYSESLQVEEKVIESQDKFKDCRGLFHDESKMDIKVLKIDLPNNSNK